MIGKTAYKKVLVIGSGPIIIGQGAEFDYSGTQACQVLKQEGIEVILVNSNPATIMTDKTIADKVYMEPLTVDFLEKVIKKELPDAMLAGMGGQTALNLTMELWDAGILDKYSVEVIGTSLESIREAEDRDLFKIAMESIDQPVIDSRVASSVEEAKKIAIEIGLPVVVRPAFTLGGTGGGIVETMDELEDIAAKGIQFSIADQVLIEKSIKGWKEIEYEMMRDACGTAIAVCNMENIDPVGIHTGDSIVIAPSQTLNDHEYQMLRSASIDIVNKLKIEGGCNVQLALHPESQDYFIIEVNPRVSRSSSLASKATGYPIAKVATKIALGYSLDEIENDITGKTKAAFEPTLDYCVVKIPKWPFDKFKDAKKLLGTMMMATGEVMAIGNNFESALLKALRSLEASQETLDYPPAKAMTLDELLFKIKKSDDERIFYLAELIRREVGLPKIKAETGIDFFFLKKIAGIVKLEEEIRGRMLEYLEPSLIMKLKKKGFSDKGMSSLMLSTGPMDIYNYRKENNIEVTYKMVDTCGGEFDAQSPYYYSTYADFDEVEVTDKKKVLVVGSGPIRIGQGVEFDYCSVHGVLALREEGIEGIIINNNPETVSTDFDISDKLYFEPITEEDVQNIIDKENPYGVILQFGGQTAVKLAEYLSERGIKILGTSFDSVDLTEDRDRFIERMSELNLPYPKGVGVTTVEGGVKEAEKLGYPLIVRPSYVIGGLGMQVVHDEAGLRKYLENSIVPNQKNPVLIDQYMAGIEIEVDAISDGKDILIPGIMEHLEQAGVHSGDSISIYPSVNLKEKHKAQLLEFTKEIATGFNLVGLLNIQYVLYNDEIYILEVNPRASRTVPFISKVTDIPMIDLATKVMLGAELESLGYGLDLADEKDYFAVKHPVFSMEKILDTEIALGPEMKSTGEILSMEKTLDKALFKGFMSTYQNAMKGSKVFLSLPDAHKEAFVPSVKTLIGKGYTLTCTQGTYTYMVAAGIDVSHMAVCPYEEKTLHKMLQDPELAFVVALPKKGHNNSTFGFKIRRLSVEKKLPCLTSFDTAQALVNIIGHGIQSSDVEVYDICAV